MATTLNLISKQTVGAGNSATVTFSNIPQTYTDLKVVWSVRSTRSAVTDPMRISFNGSSASFTNKYLSGNSSAAISGSSAQYLGEADGNTATTNTFNNGELYIPNYTGSNYKSASSDNVSENNAGGAGDAVATLAATLWSNTAAITSLTLSLDTGSFKEFSTFYLYGVSNSSTQNTSVPYATGGDVITTDGTYWYHTFLYSGTFTPLKALSCDYLVVAGGGAGGSQSAPGGGGGGGLRSTVTATGGGGSLESKLSLSTQAYTVTVGAGGAGSFANPGADGSNSVFATITSTGGGGGGGTGARNGRSGGSGGGGAADNPASTGGSASPSGQGYAGGTGYTDAITTSRGGGGGGAGAVGTNGTVTGGAGSGVNGNGGNGVATSISGSSVTYAGGGGGGSNGYGGGTGGTGGGTAGKGDNTNSTSASANTGGGSGAATGATPGNGGSGIVIVRYAV